MDFLVRFSQMHETFRVPELLALAELEGVPATVTSYSPAVPFCLIRAPSAAAAARLVRRAILVQAVYEHWGSGPTLEALHASVRQTSQPLWEAHAAESWKFRVDSFQGARGAADRADLINSFRYLPLRGPIRMRDPEQEYVVFEEWPFDPHRRGVHQQAEEKGEENGEVDGDDGDDGDNTEEGGKSGGRKSSKKAEPTRYHFGRFLGRGARDLVGRYDLKKRPYISTTSMDSELALVTANIALAGPGKLFYDPFVGTGSFPLACAAFGATSWGSDIDGRAVRGTGHDARAAGQRGAVRGEKTLRGNFRFYGVEARLGDAFTSDLTNSPLRRAPFGAGGGGGRRRLFDGIVCDPPYGVREGLRVLGCRDPEGTPWVVEAGLTKYKDPSFIPPKKPYSLPLILQDILHFASETLVDGGRCSFWMPTANDEEQELPVPTHPCFELVVVCVQPFNRWSRRLLTYRKRPDGDVSPEELESWLLAGTEERALQQASGGTADELNPFRRGYFTKFQKEPTSDA